MTQSSSEASFWVTFSGRSKLHYQCAFADRSHFTLGKVKRFSPDQRCSMLMCEGQVGTADQGCGRRTQLNKICHQGRTTNKRNWLPEKSLGAEIKQKQPEKNITQTTPAGCYSAARKDAKPLSATAVKGKSKPAFISATINVFKLVQPLIWEKKNPIISHRTISITGRKQIKTCCSDCSVTLKL